MMKGRLITKAVVLIVILVARRLLVEADPSELNRLKYPLKGA